MTFFFSFLNTGTYGLVSVSTFGEGKRECFKLGLTWKFVNEEGKVVKRNCKSNRMNGKENGLAAISGIPRIYPEETEESSCD